MRSGGAGRASPDQGQGRPLGLGSEQRARPSRGRSVQQSGRTGKDGQQLFSAGSKGLPLHREAKELPPGLLRCAAAVPVPVRPARRPVSP
jgi:hypothetical protein